MESYLRVNLLGPGPRLMKKEFTGPRSDKVKKHWYRPLSFVFHLLSSKFANCPCTSDHLVIQGDTLTHFDFCDRLGD